MNATYTHSGPRNGPGALLVHGIGVSGTYYTPLARLLAGTHHVVIPDLPGFGNSDRPRPALSIPEQAAALASVVDATGLRRPVLVGHSMGAQVVTELAVQQPGRWSGVVLIGPVTDPQAASAVRQAARLARDALHEPLSLNARVLYDYLRAGPRSFFGTLPHMLGYPLEERLAQVNDPVVLVRGDRDPIAPGEFLQRLAHAAVAAEVVQIPDSGHIAMASRPDLVAAICRGFP